MSIKIGDIFEFETGKGYAYLHYIFLNPQVTELVRVLKGLHGETPENLLEIAGQKEQFFVFLPVKAMVKKKLLKKVGHLDAENSEIPEFMRTEPLSPKIKEGWEIVNTRTWKHEYVKELSEEQKSLSPWDIWNANMLKEHLEENWSLENWTY